MWVFVLIASFIPIVISEIIRFENAVVQQPEYLTIPKYAGDEVPHWSPGNGRSYIDLSHINVGQYCPKGKCSETSTLDILVFQDKTSVSSWMEHWPDKKFCCTREMAALKECSESDAGHLFVPYSLSNVYKIRVTVKGDKPRQLVEVNHVVSRLDIKDTGLYIMVMGVCDESSSAVAINGLIDSLDPYGYLPADEFGDLPFYGSLAVAHSLVALVWAVVCYCYRQDLMFLQLWISIVLAMGMMETTTYFAYYVEWNHEGEATLGLLTFSLVLGVIKRMISRLLVLVVSMGYGVVRPSLGDDLRKVVLLGASYFVLSLLYTLFSALPDSSTQPVDDPTVDLMAVVIMLLMAVEATFYFWIFKSLASLLDSLAARKQALKYHMYKTFQSALLFSLVLTCLLGIYTVIETMGSPDKDWEDNWLFDGYWELAYFIVFTAIAFLFAPSNNYQRYAHSVQLATGDDDEDGVLGGDGADPAEAEVDVEYGGRLEDGDDPFAGKGALDVNAAVTKKA